MLELRRLNSKGYRNIGFIRTNCMKFLPFYFPPSKEETSSTFVTDVEELFAWMTNLFAQHPLFLTMDKELVKQQDVLLPYLLNHTDEAQRMKRRGQDTPYWNVFQRKTVFC
ncbi:tRNA (guanine-N(7)-)-methyltransferase [Galdieria sulphuraria]|nr:tRNA (guanine-N(7)-)-methyltransferase [Galdieria sulphuraria]